MRVVHLAILLAIYLKSTYFVATTFSVLKSPGFGGYYLW